MTTRTISVPEIHCDHCKTSIEGALNPLNGVRSAGVDVAARQVTVDHDDTVITAEALVAAIEEQGYAVPAQE
ncbi:MAG: cation transporter [Actinomycetota bacterium]|jgi:copper chaperone|nr:cation transporter [Actinomycetota bacterium]